MFGIKKFLNGLKIVPKTATSADAKGELEVIDSTGKLNFHNGTSVSPVVTESHSAALTNKTIDADSNTITNIENADIKAAAAIDAAKLADGSVSNTEFQYISTVTSNVQDQLNSKATATGLSDHINDTVDAHDASAISVSAISGLTATEVQAALAEHQVEIENTYNDLGAHITDTIDAHDASAISSIPSGNLAATEVQAALNELQSDIDTRATTSALGAHTGATSAHGVSGAIVGTSDSQTLTNKTITGADIRTPVRSDVKQDTKANLTTYALTASNGQLCFATDTKEMFQVVDTLLESVGGGAGIGGVDILFSQTFEEAALTDFTQTGMSLSTSSPIHGAISALMTHQAATSQSFKQIVAVDEKFRGQAMLLELNIKSTATAGNVTLNVYDETNAANIVASEQLTLSSATGGIKVFSAFTIPATCLSMSYTITALQEAGSPVTRIDDILCQLNNASLLETSVTVPNITAWQGYTPTFTGFGTATNIEFEWRQVGENAEIRGKFTSGTSTAVEARVSLPNGYTSAGTSIIPSLQIVGPATYSATGAVSPNVLIEPSVSYMTFGGQSASLAGLSKRTGDNVAVSGTAVSFTASVPCAGLTATSDVAIPLTQSGLVQEADSSLNLQGYAGLGAVRTKVVRFTNVKNSTGSSFQYSTDSNNGTAITILENGYYSMSFSSTGNVSINPTTVALLKNSVDFTSSVAGRTPNDELLGSSQSASSTTIRISSTAVWSGPLVAGDIIYPMMDGTSSEVPASAIFNIAKQGSLKQVNINTNSKITIPTSELRFEGASARGAVATAVVKFDTMAKIRGDAFTVTNTANDGTYVTMNKAGKLDISASIYGTSARFCAITKNQVNLTITPLASEIVTIEYTNGTGDSLGASASLFVNIGDILRISSVTTPVSDIGNSLNLTFQEQDIQVSVSNTLPQFSESDSSVRLDTANGYGSTGTKIRRFSNVPDNIGSDIQYNPNSDEATNGASFKVMTSGVYNVSYTENANAAANFGISKNASSLTTNFMSLSVSEKLAGLTINLNTHSENAAWSGYLNSGDIIRPHGDGTPAGVNDRVHFTMSKVGKPNVTGVDVTPFVNVPQPTMQSSLITFGANFSGDFVGALTSSNGSGIYSYVASTGIYTMLKAGSVNLSANIRSTAAVIIGARIYVDGVQVASDYSPATAGAEANCAYSTILQAGQTFKFQADGTVALTNTRASVVAMAFPDQILTAPETFSTDTAPLTYAGSGTYTLATLANAPVGTFITFTYAIASNTRTQTTVRPTQTDADMNTNGILLYSRPYNVASVAGNPVAIGIQIGKGMKGVTRDMYGTAGKLDQGSLDFYNYLANVRDVGAFINAYNEKTGILYIDTGYASSTAVTTHMFGSINQDAASPTFASTSGYVVINASKNPALTGLGLGTVAARGVNTAGTSIPNVGDTALTYDVAKTYDTHGALNAATGLFTVPETGYYSADWSVWFASSTYAIGNLVYSSIHKNGTLYAYGLINEMESATGMYTSSGGKVGFYLVKGDTVKVYVYSTRTAGATLLEVSSACYFSIHKTSVGN